MSVCLHTLSLSPGVRILKPQTLAAETPWQLPEVVSNLGEDLSLCDKIEPLPDERGLLRQRQQKQMEWERALSELLTEKHSRYTHSHTFLLCFCSEICDSYSTYIILVRNVSDQRLCAYMK